MSRVARHSSEEDIAALEQLCERLNGFGADLTLEWVDGYLTALLASRRVIASSEWLPAMLGDSFGRAFGDPESANAAMATLLNRWNAIASQLDVESMLDQPDDLRLAPLMVQYDDALRAEIVASGDMSAEDAEEWLQTGALWAEGFEKAIEDFADDWPDPEPDNADDALYDDARTRLVLLGLPKSALEAQLKEMFPDENFSREELVDEACFAVQDLRLHWLDHAPKPATRRVEPQPGRNDPCPCGSGKKFKKCHGMAAND